ncbi:MAG: hypothetical protein SF053_06925 [Bacteroidia bacterium]|nr:hypothetical protein [Bacteroidia bacterium]
MSYVSRLMQDWKAWVLLVVLYLSVHYEALCNSFWLLNKAVTPRTSIIYVIAGLVIAILPMFRLPAVQYRWSDSFGSWYNTIVVALKWGLFAAGTWWWIQAGGRIIAAHPLDFHQADMMPIIRAMCQRFIQGVTIYEPIPEVWGGIMPIYLPAMWVPFVPFELAGLDIRWGTVAGVVLGMLAVVRIVPSIKGSHTWWLLLVFIPAFNLSESIFAEIVARFIRFSEEGVVVGWYMFLGYALTRKNPLLQAVAITGCLLSRYSLLFWVPVYVIYMFLFQSRKQSYWLAGGITVLMLVCFLIPWGFENLDFFLSIPGEYPDFARRNRMIDPAYAHINLGLSKFFADSQIDLLFDLQLYGSLLTPVLLLGLFAWARKKNWFDPDFFALGSLKATLVVFYNLIVVPVEYLFYVNTFLSLAIWVYYVKRKLMDPPEHKAVSAVT